MRNIFLCFILICLGCSKDEDELIYNVPEEFQPIVEKFLEEASVRGFNYEITNLIITYSDELDIKYCGTCNSNIVNMSTQKIISINTSICWTNDLQKEALVFHELGHCFLGRDHDASLLPNGDPKSMMIEDDISVYSPCVYAFGDTDKCNFVFKREYYLDELFDEKTPIPDWAK